MDLLLDTHVALWWAEDPATLSSAASEAIARPENLVCFSSASAWELAIKVRAGKLSVDVGRLVDQLGQAGVRMLGIGISDAIVAGALEWAHRDPFDRMLVAQARTQNLRVLTRDAAIRSYLGSDSFEA